MSHSDKIKDCDAFFEVNPITRQIINKTPNKIVLMQGDHNSERFTFSLPRYIEGHDMAESAKAYLHYVNPTKQGSGDSHEMKDLQIDPDDAEKVICSWLISVNATKEPGALSFLIEFECFEDDVLVYSWHTLPHTSISVGATFNFKEEIATKYADVLEQWEQRLFGLSDEGVQNIETAKADALSTIGTTKENAKEEIENTQGNIINAIEKKGAETLETIPDDYAALGAKVDNVKAECDKLHIVNKKAGELISLSDSAEQPLQSMKIYGKTTQFTTTGKNKLPYPYLFTTRTINGVIFTDNGDGSISINGTATADTYFYLAGNTITPFEVGKTYCINTKMSNVQAILVYRDGNGDEHYIGSNMTTSVAWSEGYKLSNIYLLVKNGVTLTETVYPIIVEGTSYDGIWEPYTGGIPSPNPDYPQALESVGDDGSVKQVVVDGKNLFDYKSHKANGYYSEFPVVGGKTLYRNGHVGQADLWIVCDVNGNTLGNFSTLNFTSSKPLVLPKDAVYIKSTDANEIYNLPNLYIGYDSDTTYEPFTAQSLTIPTPNGLGGLNDTCDYIDLKRGVRVQRIGEYVFTGVEDANNVWIDEQDGYYVWIDDKGYFSTVKGIFNCICTHFLNVWLESLDKYNVIFKAPLNLDDGWTVESFKQFLKAQYDAGTPVKILYVLAEPIETPLTEEEIQAYKALHTNYPNTTIYNSDGADMEIEYVADTKNYIDNKFAALEAAILSTGGNV